MHGRSDVQESVVVNAQLAALVDANDGQRERERERERMRARARLLASERARVKANHCACVFCG